MSDIFEIERAASRLRRQLRLAGLPELKLLCGLRFFGIFPSRTALGLESYVREFIPRLAKAARKTNPQEFLPDEAESLVIAVGLLKDSGFESIRQDDLEAFINLQQRIKAEPRELTEVSVGRKDRTCVSCLFVEYYPDLDLPPRGRLINLYVTADSISSRAESDDVNVRNPVEEPDDQFLAQARASVEAGRAHLYRKYGLSLKKRYRFDFVVDSTGARFTGDSLGVAFAVGAVAALSRSEVLREEITVATNAAFSGALSSDGKLLPVDVEALKLKIFRAFHSKIRFLVIPRQHLIEALKYASELETQFPDRHLELVRGDRLETIVNDPRLLPARRLASSVYIVKKAIRDQRPAWVEIPALIVLLAILFFLIAPARWMPWFDNNPAYAVINNHDNSLEVFNQDSILLWADTLPCSLLRSIPATIGYGQVIDLDANGLNEVVFAPPAVDDCEERGWIRFYSHDGELMFTRYAAILNKYPADTVGVLYDLGVLHVLMIDGEPLIVSVANHDNPARMHVRLWDRNADSVGWYINWGNGALADAINLDSDGEKELLFLCFNNSMACTALLVLKVSLAEGFSPFKGYFDQKYSWLVPGTQLAYVLFPVSDIGEVPGELPFGYNFPGPNGIIRDEIGSIKVHITESKTSGSAPQLIYYLNHDLRVVSVSLNDPLKTRRQQLVAEGKLPPITDRISYLAGLRDAVTYWTDSGWVTEGQLREAEKLRF